MAVACLTARLSESTLLAAAGVTWHFGLNWAVIACSVSGVIALGGVWMEMIDASVWVYSEKKRMGVFCDECETINAIRPWSM
jgi:hypothetical protein